MFIKDTGLMECRMGKVNASIRMDLHTKEIGEIINRTDWDLRNMKMVHPFEEILLGVLSKVKGNLYGKMDRAM